MKHTEMIDELEKLERLEVYVLGTKDLHKLFPQEGEKAMEKSLQRMCKQGVLIRASRGLYVNARAARRRPRWILEHIAMALRPGHLTYVSLESALSEYGAISQIPMSRLTLMTTGSSGLVKTPWGELEYTHTKRSHLRIIERTVHDPQRPMRMATLGAAVKDLVRVGRNTEMIDWSFINDEENNDDGEDSSFF